MKIWFKKKGPPTISTLVIWSLRCSSESNWPHTWKRATSKKGNSSPRKPLKHCYVCSCSSLCNVHRENFIALAFTYQIGEFPKTLPNCLLSPLGSCMWERKLWCQDLRYKACDAIKVRLSCWKWFEMRGAVWYKRRPPRVRLQLCISFLRFLFSVPFGGRDSVIVVKSTGRKIVDRFRRNASVTRVYWK